MKQANYNNRSRTSNNFINEVSSGSKSFISSRLLATGCIIALFVTISFPLQAMSGMKSSIHSEAPCKPEASAVMIAAGEKSLKLENWMTDIDYFRFSYLIEEAEESSLVIEKWMLNTGYFDLSALTCNMDDEELVLKGWMTDMNYFQKVQGSNPDEALTGPVTRLAGGIMIN